MRTSRKTDFRKLKITLVASTYPGQRSQCPLSVPSCSLGFMNIPFTLPKTVSCSSYLTFK